MSEEKQVAKRTQAEIEAAKILSSNEFTGFEGTTSEMLNTPFLKIAQTNTRQADEGDPSHIPGLKPGYFFNNQTGTVYGKKIKVVPLFAKSSYLYYGSGTGNYKGEFTEEQIDKMVRDGVLKINDGAPGWHDSDGGKCFFVITFFCFLPDHPLDGILPFVTKSKQLKHAKNWNSLSQGLTVKVGKETRKAARYQIVWELETVKDENDLGTWYNLGDKTGSKIKMVGNIFEETYAGILPTLADAVKLIEEMRKQKINYASESDAIVDDEKNDFED